MLLSALQCFPMLLNALEYVSLRFYAFQCCSWPFNAFLCIWTLFISMQLSVIQCNSIAFQFYSIQFQFDPNQLSSSQCNSSQFKPNWLFWIGCSKTSFNLSTIIFHKADIFGRSYPLASKKTKSSWYSRANIFYQQLSVFSLVYTVQIE